MSLTIDASVFISSARPAEIHYLVSQRFVSRLFILGQPIVCPSLVLPECAATMGRQTGNIAFAARLTQKILAVPQLQLIVLDTVRAQQTATLAALLRLRGADAVYVAVAQEFGTTLITWDAEMLARGPAAVPTLTPTDWLAANPTI